MLGQIMGNIDGDSINNDSDVAVIESLEEGYIALNNDQISNQAEVYETVEEQREVSRFVLTNGEESYSLYYGVNSVGRDDYNDLIIKKDWVSAIHATLVVSKEKIEVHDHSSNGTYINLEQVKYSILSVGDQISFAQFTYVLEKLPKTQELPKIQQVAQENEFLIGALVTETAYVQSFSNLPSFSSVNQTRRPNAGFTLIELLIVIAIVGILSSISVLNIISSRRAANSASAVQSLRVISSSQATYSAGAGNGEYATPDSLLREEFIDSSLAGAALPTPTNVSQKPKSGYLFSFHAISSDSVNNIMADYQISAKPLLGSGLARGGDKCFFVDATGVIKFSPSAIIPADANSQPIN